jgi:very-short-patch-repair endonuclease
VPNPKASRLRQNSTDAERRMWSALRDRRLLRYKFRRQHPIGDFIVDFACTKHALVIEVDGGQHADNAADTRRTARLESQGWMVVRFWNNEVLNNIEGVIETILRILQQK